MKLACLCPTYKRPTMLATAAACFLSQRLPEGVQARLFVLDDAQQYHKQILVNDVRKAIQVSALSARIPFELGLPEKYRQLIALANEWQPHGYVIWEDDDVFLPEHLEQIATAFNRGARYYRLDQQWSTYRQEKGKAFLDNCTGRFHSGWAFSREVYEEIGGYPVTSDLSFDQQLGRLLAKADPNPPLEGFKATYVYRWGSGSYNGSQLGGGGYRQLWEEIGKLPAPWVGNLKPEFDREAKDLYRYLAGVECSETV